MNGIEISNYSEVRRKDNRHTIASLLFLLAGIFGILFILHSLKGISYNGWMVYTITAILCGSVWYTFFYRRNWFYYILCCMILLWGFAAWWLRMLFFKQIKQIGNAILRTSNAGSVSVTETVLLLAILLIFLLFLLEFVIRNHMVLYLITTELLLLPPLMGIQTGIEVVWLLLLFQIAFWVLHVIDTERGRWLLSGVQKYRISAKSSIVIGSILLGTFVAAFFIVSLFSQKLYDSVYGVEGYVSRTWNHVTGKSGRPVANGQIGRGNNYKTKSANLELTFFEKPTETFYLRGFIGGQYQNGNWTAANDSKLLDQTAGKLGNKNWFYKIEEMYQNLYFELNSETDIGNPQNKQCMIVQHSNGKYNQTYVPYYSRACDGYMTNDVGPIPEDGYIYEYYEQKDILIDWEDLDFEQYYYKQIEREYKKEARFTYTWVSSENLPRLTKLVEENPFENLDEISAFILYTLHSNASYTLTPGWTPFNQDIVEYFLFESGKGYCVHFASAAVLMYRLYGIPARYASGYAISPSDHFELGEDGLYHLTVTDESAHAWPEIFLEGYGWIPIEVTPAADGSALAVYPGFDEAKQNQIMNDYGWDMSLPSLLSHQDENLQNEAESRSDVWFHFGQTELQGLLKWMEVLGISFLCVFPCFLDYIRLKRVQKFQQMGCCYVFMKLMQMFHYGGYLLDYDGTEGDFSAVFVEQMDLCTEERIRRMQEIVSRAAYGPYQANAKEEEFVRRFYVDSVDYVYQHLKWYQKWCFWYFKAYG